MSALLALVLATGTVVHSDSNGHATLGTVADSDITSSYAGVGSCSSGNYVSALLRNAAPTCSALPSAAPTTSKYIIQTADATLPNAQVLGALSTGLLKSTTTTGVLSIAGAGSDYVASITGGGAVSHQFVSAITSAGAVTLAQPGFQDLSAGATVDAPLTGSGLTASHLGCQAASGSQAGCLSSTDWSTFNGKQAAGSYLTAVTADAPLSGSGTSGSHLVCAAATGSVAGCLSSTDWTTFNNKAPATSGSVILLGNGSGGFSSYGGATSCTNQFFTGLSSTGGSTCTTDTLAGAQHANQGTTTTVLHGNGAGNPSWAGIGVNDFTANQGTTTQVLHGNASGQPSWAAIAAADLPNPTASTLGGIESIAATTNQWVDSISTSGVPHQSQPAFSNLSGSVAASQMPALTGDVTTSAGAVATTLKNTGSAGSCGSATQSCAITFDAQGRETAESNTSIALTHGSSFAALTDHTKTFVTGDVNVTSATAGPVTGLTLSVAASTSYGFKCVLVETNTATSAMRWAVSTPASPTTVAVEVIHHTTSLAATVNEALTAAWATTCTNCTAAVTTSVSATTHATILGGVVLNGSNTGSIQIFAAASTAAQANVVKKGSFCEWWTP